MQLINFISFIMIFNLIIYKDYVEKNEGVIDIINYDGENQSD